MSDPRQPQFWDDEERALWDALNQLIIVTLMDGVGEGVNGLPSNYQVLADWNVVNQSVLEYAKIYRYDLIKKITDTTRNQVQTAITDWMREGSPLEALTARLEPVFGAVRAEMIAVTETTRVFAEGNKMAWDSTGVVNTSKWQTANDDLVCPICGPLNDQVTEEMPPAHVNCRCWKRPVVDETAVARRFAEIYK